ncbi:MAG: hypothetical protein M1829_005221, partial [Trizodia sp. TS-e1964]
AIEHAVKKWKVDIITMSLGFPKPIEVIERTIKKAFAENVIIFAATSNGGPNQDVAFPACAHDLVIGVHSCDAYGNKSFFSPEPLENSHNFSVLGEAIESRWPKHLKIGSTQCRSGTSYPTPIAAGMAANLLLYARMKLPDQQLVKEIEQCAGMKKLLKSLSKVTTEGYSSLRPWDLWSKSEDVIAAHFLVHMTR